MKSHHRYLVQGVKRMTWRDNIVNEHKNIRHDTRQNWNCEDATFFIILQVLTENILETKSRESRLKSMKNQLKNKILLCLFNFFLRLFVSMNIWQSGVKAAPLSTRGGRWQMIEKSCQMHAEWHVYLQSKLDDILCVDVDSKYRHGRVGTCDTLIKYVASEEWCIHISLGARNDIIIVIKKRASAELADALIRTILNYLVLRGS